MALNARHLRYHYELWQDIKPQVLRGLHHPRLRHSPNRIRIGTAHPAPAGLLVFGFAVAFLRSGPTISIAAQIQNQCDAPAGAAGHGFHPPMCAKHPATEPAHIYIGGAHDPGTSPELGTTGQICDHPVKPYREP